MRAPRAPGARSRLTALVMGVILPACGGDSGTAPTPERTHFGPATETGTFEVHVTR